MTTASTTTDRRDMRVSVWLMPPADVQSPLRTEIARLAKESSPFEPHVTVVGGIPCESVQRAGHVAKTLQAGLKGFGTVPVQLATKAEGNVEKWNQALYFPVQETPEFMRLCQTTRELMGMEGIKDWKFPAPANRPHLSLYYGHRPQWNSCDCKAEDIILPLVEQVFLADHVALWRTDPATVDGVQHWEQLAVIDLT